MRKILILLLLSSPIIAKKEITTVKTTSDSDNEGNSKSDTYRRQYGIEHKKLKTMLEGMSPPLCLFVLRNFREQNKNNQSHKIPNPRLDAIKDLLLQVEKFIK